MERVVDQLTSDFQNQVIFSLSLFNLIMMNVLVEIFKGHLLLQNF